MRLVVAIALLLFTGCSETSKADKVHKLMLTCYDDLEFHPRPFSCEDALKGYRELDMRKVDSWKRVQMRMTEGAIAERMR